MAAAQGVPAGAGSTLKPWEAERRGVFEDQVLLLEQLGSGASQTVNTGFYRLLELFRGVFCPKLNGYEKALASVLVMQQIASPHLMALIAKYLQVTYEVENFLLLLSLGSLVPFLIAFKDLVLFIPCPQMAAVVSNTSIMLMLGVLVIMGYVGGDGFSWRTYIYVFMIWPLVPIGSMIARQYITRDKQVNQFSPITTLPFLASIGVTSAVLGMVAMKKITVTDYLVVTSLDSEWAAFFASLPIYFGIDRFKLHFLFAKYYLVHLFFVSLYFLARESPPETTPPVVVFGVQFQDRTWNLCLATASRALIVMRSIMLKVNFAQFNSAEFVTAPRETYESLFQTHEPPRKHRFARFPGPVLLTLDAAFDSGLADSEMHGVGPLGTHDLFILTDFTYMLPMVSLASYFFEDETLGFGFSPPTYVPLDNVEDQLDSSLVDSNEPYARIITPQQQALIVLCILIFVLCYSLQPTATSKYLFSRGSSIHTWKWRPVALTVLPFFVDVFSLNLEISKVQILMAILIGLTSLELRSGLWTLFKRKYLAILTKELHYHMPSTLRALQKRTLLEFLEMTNTDDFEILLLETCIYHGNNIREFTRQTGMTVYDPRPSATAAWKLATSIVMKALKHEKKARKEAQHAKVFMVKFVKELVAECAYKAVELADGHGARLKLADIHARQRGKLRALKKLRLLVVERRGRRRAKQTYLSSAPVILASTGGAMRGINDVTQPKFAKDRKAAAQGGNEGGDAAPTGLPGPEVLNGGPPAVPRGIKTLGLPNIDDGYLPGLLSSVLGFGADAQGQLGLQSATGLKTHVMPIDELRSKDFVQVVTGGCCTFFVADSGKVLGSGSNRSLEIGFRMEIAQVETPQIIKPLRAHKVVQLATSPSSLGQAHTLALTSGGDVYAFGTSNCGALGLEHFTQSFPEPIRMTHTVPMIQVACGGRHSLFLSETGEVFATGDNRYGQLGIPDITGTGTVMKVEVPSMRMVACGENHSLAVLSAGGVFSWGANSAGQCGLEHVKDVKVPAKVRFPMLPKQTAPFELISIAGGSQHTLVAVMVGPASFVLGCGSNVDGQLGLGAPLENGDTHFLAPFPVAGFAGDPARVIVQVACAGTHSLALARTGETYAFGSNRFGQLGYLPPGGRERASSKVKLTKFDGVSNLWEPTRIDPLRVHHVRYISTSDRHSMVIAA